MSVHLQTWNLYQSICLSRVQKALEAHGCKPWVTNFSTAPHTLGIVLTTNVPYCIIFLEYVNKSQVKVRMVKVISILQHCTEPTSTCLQQQCRLHCIIHLACFINQEIILVFMEVLSNVVSQIYLLGDTVHQYMWTYSPSSQVSYQPQPYFFLG